MAAKEKIKTLIPSWFSTHQSGNAEQRELATRTSFSEVLRSTGSKHRRLSCVTISLRPAQHPCSFQQTPKYSLGGRQQLELLQLLWNSLCFNPGLLMVIFSPEHNVIPNPFVLLWQLTPAAVSCQGALYSHWGFAYKLVLITSGKWDFIYALSPQGKMIHSMMAQNLIYNCTPCTKWQHLSCDQHCTSEQLTAVGEQSLTTSSEATYWCKKLPNYSLGHINTFPELLGGNCPSCFTSTSIYSAISSSADSVFGKLSTLLFQPDMSPWGSNCPCSVTAFMHCTKRGTAVRIQEDFPHLGTTCPKSYSFHLHLNDISAPHQSHSCSGSRSVAAPLQTSFTSPPGLTLSLKRQRRLKSCTKVLNLEELNIWQQN